MTERYTEWFGIFLTKRTVEAVIPAPAFIYRARNGILWDLR